MISGLVLKQRNAERFVILKRTRPPCPSQAAFF
jgi:hypothetical protein